MDIHLMDKEDVFWFHQVHHHQFKFVQVDLQVMEMEIVLLIQFLFFVHLDSTVMEMEIVFWVHLLFHKFVHLD